MDSVRWRVQCFGQVQCVGFRYTALYLARRLGVTGWVRNLPDGSVLLEAQGSQAELRQLLIRLKSRPQIHIERAEITEIPTRPEERQFRVVSEYDEFG